jgi:PadR family transcriptional regulator, regulatory protein AphA
MPKSLSTTSYALLGLLSVRPWTTYELAKQVQRSLHWFWPRAERKLYDEPKELARQGLVSVEEKFTGKRRSREYSITPDGRAALAGWLSEPPAAPMAEFEGLVKVFFADVGGLDQLRITLSRIEAEAVRRVADLRAMAVEGSSFPERAHIGALTLALELEIERAVVAWGRWAREQVADWDTTTDPGGWDSRAVHDRLVREADELIGPG